LDCGDAQRDVFSQSKRRRQRIKVRPVRASLILLCLFGWVASLVAAETSHLAVQVVLPDWLPNPTVSVHVTNVKSCAARAEPVFPKATKTTDLSGTATFDVPGTGYYRIEVPKQGGPFVSVKD